jgi:AcrR family transcriptional regulator
MGRRNEHSREQQREMALAAAELILVKEGMAGLTMRKVAQEIGYTVGNLYLLFANQDDLLAALNERTTDAMYSCLRDAVEPLGNPREQLRAMANAYIAYAQRNPHRWRMMFEHDLPDAMEPRPSADMRIRRMFELVESCLGKLMPGAKPEHLRSAATALWSGVHGICVLAVTGKLKWSGGTDYAPLCDYLIDTFLAGLAHTA